MAPLATAALALSIAIPPNLVSGAYIETQVVVGVNATSIERYAARELQRYVYQVSGRPPHIVTDLTNVHRPSFVVGQRHTNRLLKKLVADGHLKLSPKDPGPEGYVLKTIQIDGPPLLAIGGCDDVGCLYGVYGLLEDYYHVGFNLGGDILPAKNTDAAFPQVDERKSPAMAIRGILPWSNFPQSPAAYSWEDWKFILDQMAKMRFNFILVHNYNGERGHNEMFHNFAAGGLLSRVSMATARSGHGWHGPKWEINQYRYGADALFDDYDFGADCALHNETLSNEHTFRKGVALFQSLINHAHSRGIKVGLGLDIDVIPPEYGRPASDPEVVAARAAQIATDYADLDFLFCFQSEYPAKELSYHKAWRTLFMAFYSHLRMRVPEVRLVASGWGLDPNAIAGLPPDVICAPIAQYSDRFESGSLYGQREYWGCPWLERDYQSSQYYYPYNVHLSNTIEAYRDRAPNMKGLFALTWRLTDAVEPKLSFLSKAPWDAASRFKSASEIYRHYAEMNYGAEAAKEIVKIIGQNEPFACDSGECEGTPSFLPSNRRASTGLFRDKARSELAKANSQLAVIDKWIARSVAPEQRRRLELLRCRIAATRDHIDLNQNFQHYQWANLPGAMESWVQNFTHRVTDISSLGNVVSVQNRYVQLQSVAKENNLRAKQPVKSPAQVVARGTPVGAVITWKNEQPETSGYHVYRNGKRINTLPISPLKNTFTDNGSGSFRYTITALGTNDTESPHSIPAHCEAGSKDRTAPYIIVISPPASLLLGQSVPIKVRLLDGRSYESLSARLLYRQPGQSNWRKLNMRRRARAVFAAAIPPADMNSEGLEYFIEACDGDNTACFPPSAPGRTLSVIACQAENNATPAPPSNPGSSGQTLSWTSASGSVLSYRIYRASDSDFQPGPENFLTYVAKDTTTFTDNGLDFDSHPLQGTRFYRISAMDKAGNESMPTASVPVLFGSEVRGEPPRGSVPGPEGAHSNRTAEE